MMDGYSQWNESESRPYIILASDKDNYYRSRFDAAHELDTSYCTDMSKGLILSILNQLRSKHINLQHV